MKGNSTLIKARSVAALLIFACATKVNAQINLTELLNRVSVLHPAAKAAQYEVNASEEDIETIKLQRWPTVATTVESDTGTTRYQSVSSLKIEKTVWDSGLLTNKINEAQARMKSAEFKLALQRRDLQIEIINAWQLWLGSNTKENIAVSTLAKLNSYKAQAKRRIDAEVSPQIDLEVLESKIMQTEVERVQAHVSSNAAINKIVRMAAIQKEEIKTLVAPSFASSGAILFAKSSVLFGSDQDIQDRDAAVNIAKMQAKIYAEQLKIKKSEAYPQVYVRAEQPILTGGTTGNRQDTPASIFLGIRYTPSNGFVNISETKALVARLAATEESIDSATRLYLDSMQSEIEILSANEAKIDAVKISIESNKRVIESFTRQFLAGRKSWLELVNAVREGAQAEYALAEAQTSLSGSVYRIQVRAGFSGFLP
jgi:adhesin transport system outer membrane protein